MLGYENDTSGVLVRPEGEPAPSAMLAPPEPALKSQLRNHPRRYVLHNEVHARPFEALGPPERVSHLAVYGGGEQGAAEDHACLVRLCERYGITPPRAGVDHFSQTFGPFRLKWERHTEFVTYTFFQRGPFDDPFRAPAIAQVARDWLEQLSGEVLVAVHVTVLPREAAAPTAEDLAAHFIADTVVGSVVAGGAAAAFTDYQIHADGFSRILVHDRSLSERQAGRLVQRLLEIETYRVMALLAFPLAREMAPEISRCERELAEVTAAMAGPGNAEEERGLLDRLLRLAASIERISAAASYRFRAARAYHALVGGRIEELREGRLPGLQTVAEFMERRLLPAMRTCASTAERLENLSQRLARASDLLRTRVDIAVQAQNRDVLRSVDQRARLQLLLQETVEGLSAFAITYYFLGILAYALDGLHGWYDGFDAHAVVGLTAPVAFAVVWLVLRRIRRRLMRDQDAKLT